MLGLIPNVWILLPSTNSQLSENTVPHVMFCCFLVLNQFNHNMKSDTVLVPDGKLLHRRLPGDNSSVLQVQYFVETQAYLPVRSLSGHNKQPWVSVSDSRNRWCRTSDGELISHRGKTDHRESFKKPTPPLCMHWDKMMRLHWLVFLHPQVEKHWHDRMFVLCHDSAYAFTVCSVFCDIPNIYNNTWKFTFGK